MSEQGCGSLTVLDVAEALQANYAFISGGRSRRSFPIITFPECPSSPLITDEQHRHVVLYLTSIPSRQEIDLGFVIIVDRRLDKWSNVKTVLLRIVDHFPALVQKIYVLQPSSFFQKTFADTNLKFLKDDVKFKILVLSTAEELHNHVDKDQLTTDLGGTLLYNHQEWMQHRAALEKFSVNVRQIEETLTSLCARLQETEFPNDVAQTEELKADHAVARQEVTEDLKSTVHHGEALRDCFAAVAESDDNEQGQLPLCRLANISAVERLIAELDETTNNFAKFWTRHERRLDQCLQLRKFEEQFKVLQFSCEQHLTVLLSMVELGDSVAKVDALIVELKEFEGKSKENISSASRLRDCGENFIEADHYAVDCIRPKCLELERICTEYNAKLKERQHLLQASRDLYDKIEKATRWCTKGVDLLASQVIEQCNTEAGAQSAVHDIELFMQETNDFKLDNPAEFHAQYKDVLTPQLQETVQQVLLRLDDVQSMFNKRLASLRQLYIKPVRPVQTVHPKLSASPAKSVNYPDRQRETVVDKETPSKKFRPPFGGKGRLVRSLSQSTFYEVETHESDVTVNGSKSTDFRRGSTIGEKRSHVMKELIDTERVYVEELQSVVQGYMMQMDQPEMAKLLPYKLIGKKDVLFGNLEQIYNFHAKVFLKDLEDCSQTPTLVGRCFMARKSEFQMYGTYCQNKVLSEELRRSVGDQNAFFKECQRIIGHRLPLGAYLLRPVQRITQYQLLLKEMLKYCEGDDAGVELKESLESMQNIVKHVNDAMHQISITGFDGNLASQGELLMQGSFNVWAEQKRLKDLRFKPMSRHIFLYELLIIFCKKKDSTQNSDKPAYVYKNSLPTLSIGLTENVKGDRRKFELWLSDRSQVFTVQAASPEIKNAWVIEIMKVLQNQFEKLKEVSQKNNNSYTNWKVIPRSEAVLGDAVSLADVETEAIRQQHRKARRSRNKSISSLKEVFKDSVHRSVTADSGLSSANGSDGKKSMISASLHNLHDIQVYGQYVAVDSYVATELDELTIHEGETLQLLAVGDDNWWQVKSLLSGLTGWVPARYLDAASKQRSAYSLQSSGSGSPGKTLEGSFTASLVSLRMQ